MSLEAPPASSQRLIGQFLADLASPTPVPGGGSAAALAGALAAALIAMVARLNANRPRSRGEQVESVLNLAARADTLRERLQTLVDEDAEAYAHVRSAYRLPRTTEAERALRAGRVQAALRLAIAPPLATATTCTELLRMAALAAEQASFSTSSDAYTAALLAHAALLASEQNVMANLQGLHDEALRGELGAQLAAMKRTAGEALAQAQAASRPEGKPSAQAR